MSTSSNLPHDGPLYATIRAAIPASVTHLGYREHLDTSPRSAVYHAVRGYAYSFVHDARYRPFFEPFTTPEEQDLQDQQHASTSHSRSASLSDTLGNEHLSDHTRFARAAVRNVNQANHDDDDSLDSHSWTLRAAQAQASSNGVPNEYARSRKGRPCGHVFKEGESVYRCKDCSLDETCVLCSRCYKASDHRGHEVSFSMHSGGCGCCDCGDPEAWRRDVHCAFHHPDVPYPGAVHDETPTAQPPSMPIPDELMQLVQFRIQEAFDFIIDALRHCPPAGAPPERASHIQNTPPLFPPTPDSTRLGSRYGNTDWVGFELGKGPYSIILWNDEKHSYEQVIEALVTSLKCSKVHAFAAASRIDHYGLEAIATSSDHARLHKIAKYIGALDLATSVCASRDVVMLEAVGLMLDWLRDMTQVKMGGDEVLLGRCIAGVLTSGARLTQLLALEDKLWKRGRKTLRRILMTLLVVGQDYKLDIGTEYASIYPHLMSVYLLNDREPDNSVLQFSVQLFSAPSIAERIVAYPGQNFLKTAIEFLYSFFTQQHTGPRGEKRVAMPPSYQHTTIDPESSSFKHKRYYSVFSDLSHLLSQNEVQKQIATSTSPLSALLTFFSLFDGMNPLNRASGDHVEYENEAWVTAFNLTIQLGKLARSFGRSYRYCQLLTDTSSGQILFHGYPTDRLRVPLAYVFTSIMSTAARHPNIGKHWQQIPFGQHTHFIMQYVVSTQPVSFHHCTHLLLAEMLKHVNTWDGDYVRQVLVETKFSGTADGSSPLIIFEEMLQTLAFLAHIRAGMWVRNGFAIRAQYLHYREYNLRENTYDQDIFLLQCAFEIVDANLLLTTMLDRFEVLAMLPEWRAPGAQTSSIEKDDSQAMQILEDFLYTLVVAFSEPENVCNYTIERVTRRELIHALVLGPLAYSEVLKSLTEKVQESPVLEYVLTAVATFRPPDPTTVTSEVGGMYLLKQELFNEVDPYYYRYTRNQREEAMKLLKQHNGADYLHKPHAMRPVGAFADSETKRFARRQGHPDATYGLLAATTSDAMIYVLWHTLHFVNVTIGREAAYPEAVMDMVLHLMLISLTYSASELCAHHVFPAIIQALLLLRDDDRAKDHKLRIDHIIATVNAVRPDTVAEQRRHSQSAASPSATSPKSIQATLAQEKRQAAKARQDAIMQKFAAAHQSLLAEYGSDDDDDGGDVEMRRSNSAQSDAAMDEDIADLTDNAPKGKKAVKPVGSCIVCQEDLDGSQDFGSLSLIQNSNLMRLLEAEKRAAAVSDSDIAMADPARHVDNLRHRRGMYASACGHMMHASCFKTYCETADQRHSSQMSRNHPDNPLRKEFICPLCKSLGNVLLPYSRDQSDDHTDIQFRASDKTVSGLTSAMDQAVRLSTGGHKLGEAVAANALRQEIRSLWRISADADTPFPTRDFSRIEMVAAALEAEQEDFEFDDQHTRVLPYRSYPQDLVAYTLSVIEVSLRRRSGGSEAIKTPPTHTLQLLRSLLLMVRQQILSDDGDISQAFAALMVPVLNPGWHQHFLDRDPLVLFLEGLSLDPDSLYYLTNLTFYAHLVRTSTALSAQDFKLASLCGPAEDEDVKALSEFFLVLQHRRWKDIGTQPSSDMLANAQNASKSLYTFAMPFLRRLSIVHAALRTDIQPDDHGSSTSEFQRLLSTLQISHPLDVLRDLSVDREPANKAELYALINIWRQTWRAPPNNPPGESVQLEDPLPYELVTLPHHFDELIEASTSRRCPNCNTVPADPAICLLCGQLVCQQSYCCMDSDGGDEAQHGECNTHMWSCGASMGIFLLVRKCALIYLYADKGTFGAAPYLDAHGEADLGLRKHRPLYLNPARYDEVRRLWLTHSVATVVARRLEASNDQGGWNTF